MLLTSCAVSSVIAFGPQLERLSQTNCCPQHVNTSRLHVSKSKSKSNNDSEDKNELPNRLQTSGFDFVPAPFDGFDDFSFLFDRGVFDGTFPVLQEQARALALETLDETSDFDGWDDCGDDCKECEIPIDWCVPGETMDVMEYLGVTRVKPLC